MKTRYLVVFMIIITLLTVNCKKKTQTKTSLIKTDTTTLKDTTKKPKTDTSSEQQVYMTSAIQQKKQQQCKTIKKFKLPDLLNFFVNNEKLPPEFSFLYPIENMEKFQTTTAQAKILGIYSADMIYALIFDNPQLFIQYYNAVYELTTSLGITNMTTQQDIKNITTTADTDTLTIEIRKTINKICISMENSGMTDIMPFVIYSSWLESNYLLVNYLYKVKRSDLLFKKLKEQSQIIKNMENYLNDALTSISSYQMSKQLQPLIEDIAHIDTLYTNIYQQTDLVLDDTQLKNLEQKISVFRNNLVK